MKNWSDYFPSMYTVLRRYYAHNSKGLYNVPRPTYIVPFSHRHEAGNTNPPFATFGTNITLQNMKQNSGSLLCTPSSLGIHADLKDQVTLRVFQ